jgi:acid phosphatase
MLSKRLTILAIFGSFAGAQTRDAHEKLQSTLWTQTSVEYRASTVQAYAGAREMLIRGLKDKKWTAATEQSGNYRKLPPAVILDIDETVLDNTPAQARFIRQGVDYDVSEWNRWVTEAKAAPLAGAVEFIRFAASKKVTPFFVTNRTRSQEPATRENLVKAGFPVSAVPHFEDNVLTAGERPEWTSDKTSRRAAIAQHYRVVLLIGDDFNDFISARVDLASRAALFQRYEAHFGRQWFILSNPAYGSWEDSLLKFDRTRTDAQVLSLKRDSLDLK